MKFIIKNPIKAYITDYTPEELSSLKEGLTYVNTSKQYLLKKHYQNKWFRSKNPDGWNARTEELKASIKNTLIFEEGNKIYVRPGSLPYVSLAGIENIHNDIKYPKLKKIPWAKPLPFELYPYQSESVDKLLEVKHGNVSIATGCGKTAIIVKLLRETGLKAAVITPSKSIFEELFTTLETHFGQNKIGSFGDGKKKLDKNITICIGDSLANIQKDTEEWEFFSKLDMIIVDESHLFAAETLETTCHGVLGSIPYRFFLSGTQERGDGTTPLLNSIIGKTVVTLTTAEAVKGGYICPHDFLIIETQSSNPNMNARDPLEEKRIHFLNNKNIAQIIARLCNINAKKGKQTLVLVEELNQIKMLTDLLEVPYAYAHSESKKDRLSSLGLEKVSPTDSVKKFNRNDVQVLIGTSCISTGTNIYPTHFTINWIGGSSLIKTCQGPVGRSVRKGESNPWHKNCLPKDKATIIDFDVKDNYTMHRHLKDRIEFYKFSGSEIRKAKLS
jgi:superfamily II DNA or RNA helicase